MKQLLRHVHTKDNNYKDKVLKIVLNIKSPTKAIMIKAQISLESLSERFFQLMNDTNMISNQNPSCYHELENVKQQTSALRINRSSFAGVDANIVIVLSVNGPL